MTVEINTATMMPSGTHVVDVMKFTGSDAMSIDALAELQVADPIPHARNTSVVLGGLDLRRKICAGALRTAM